MAYGLDLGPDAVRAARDTGRGMEIDTSPLGDGGACDTGSAGAVEGTEQTQTVGQTGETGEPISMDTLEAAVDSVLTLESGAETLCYAIPDPVGTNDVAATRYREAVDAATAAHDISLTAIDRGFAVIYDQLSADKFTGLGVYLGRQTTTVSLAYYGVPALSFSLPIGSEWVLEQATAECGAARETVAETLETFALDPDTTGEIEQALAQAYDAVIASILEELLERADDGTVQESVAVPVAVAGSGAVDGLEFLIGGRFDAAPLPFSIRGVRFAEAPTESAVRGAATAAADGVDGTIEWDELETTAEPDTESTNSSASGGDTETALTFDDGAATAADPSDKAIDDLFDRLGDRDAELEALRDDLESVDSSLTTTLEGLSDRTAAVEAELEETASTAASETELNALEDEVSTLEEALDRLEDDLESRQEAHEAHVGAVDDRLAETVTTDDLETLEDRLADLAQTVDDDTLTETVETLEDDLETLDRRFETQSSQFESQEARLEGVSGRLEELTTRIDAIAGDLDDERDARETQLEEIERVVETGLEDVEDSLTADLESAETRTAALEEELEATTATVSDVTDEIETLESSVEDLDERTAAAPTDVDLERVEAPIDALEAEISGLETRIEERHDKHTDLAETVETLESTVEELPDEGTVVTATAHSAVTDRIGALEDDAETRAERLEEHADQLTALDETADRVAALAEQVDTVATQTDTSDIESTLTDLETRLESVADQQPSAETISALEDRVSTLEEGHAETPATADVATQTEFETLQTELESVRSRVSEMDEADDDALDGPSLVQPIAAGGGSAGLVAGFVAILGGSGMVGAGALIGGALVLIGAIATARKQ